MNRLLLLLTCLMAVSVAQAQQASPREKNYFFSFNSFDPLTLGFAYKVNVHDGYWRKWGLTDLRADIDHREAPGLVKQNIQYYSIGGVTGWEWRKQITERLYFYHGPSVGLSAAFARNSFFNFTSSYYEAPRNTISGTVSAYWSAGILANITDHIMIGGELNPGASFTVSNTFQISQHTLETGSSLRLGFLPNFATLSLIFRAPLKNP